MVKYDELIKGKYYEVIYKRDFNGDRKNIYIVQAKTDRVVNVLFRNGIPHEVSGMVRGAASILEVTEEYAMSHIKNKNFAHLLKKER